MTAAAPVLPELHAPATWQLIDFISDLHLQAGDPATVDTWKHYLSSTPAQAIFILGDLFEVWVGDDAAPQHQRGATGLRQAASRVDAHWRSRVVLPKPAGARVGRCAVTAGP